MQLKSNIPEIIERLERFKTAVGGNSNSVPPGPDIADAMLSALNAGMGQMKFRIFNKGLDAEGNSLGRYTKAYAKKRERLGRQTAYKDLEVTGSLRRAIEVAKEGNQKVVIAFVNEGEALIAGYQEKQTNTRIFTPSQSEFEFIQAEGNAAIRQTLIKMYNEQ